MHESTKLGPKPALSKATTAQLVDALAHPNGWWRDTAQQLLVQRADRAIPMLKSRAATAPDWRTRLHALWTLDGFDAIEPADVTRALADQSRDVRASAVRLSERWLGDPKHPIQAEVLKRLDDKDWAVRRQLAATLGTIPDSAPAKASALATLLERHGDDPITVDAALSGLSGSEQAVLQRLLASETASPQRTAAVTMLAATIVRGGQDARVQNVFQSAADRRAAWQRDALLEGAEAALAGGPYLAVDAAAPAEAERPSCEQHGAGRSRWAGRRSGISEDRDGSAGGRGTWPWERAGGVEQRRPPASGRSPLPAVKPANAPKRCSRA